MKISFDLDDTIIPGIKTFATEPQTLIHRIFGIEKIRKGTIELFKALKLKITALESIQHHFGQFLKSSCYFC